MKIYLIIYIFLLEPANPEIPVSTKLSRLSPENKYKITKILTMIIKISNILSNGKNITTAKIYKN